MADITQLDITQYNSVIGGDLNTWAQKEQIRDGLVEDKVNEVIVAVNEIRGSGFGLDSKLDKDGYIGTAQDLKDEIDLKADLIGGKVPLSQMDDSLIGAVEYRGVYNANTNTPTLTSTPSEKGIYYVVEVGGTQFGLTFGIGDWIISNGTMWQKLDNSITKEEIGLGNVDNTSDLTKMTVSEFVDLDTVDKTIVGAINEHESDLIALDGRVDDLELNDKVRVYNTVAEMQADSANIAEGMTIQLLGYYSKNDGAGHMRKIESSDDGSGIAVGGLWANIISLFNDTVSLSWFGANGDGITDDTQYIQKALIQTNYNTIQCNRKYLASFATLRSNLTLEGVGEFISKDDDKRGIFTTTTDGINAGGNINLENIKIKGLTFDGKLCNTAQTYDKDAFFLKFDGDGGVKNIEFKNCTFKNLRGNGVYITAFSENVLCEDIKMESCRAITEDSVKVTRSMQDLIRIEQIYDYSNLGNGYGNIHFKNIEVLECYGKYIRTVADLKRGCYNFKILNNTSINTTDCHHSVDGSFLGVISGNTGNVTDLIAGSTGTNFVEVQGEDIVICYNTFNGGTSSNRLVRDGIQITDYGRPQEAEKGHNSKNIIIHDNIVKNLYGSGYRMLNAVLCKIHDNIADTCTNFPATCEGGTGGFEADGVTRLQTAGCEITNNKYRNCSDGVYAKFCFIRNNRDNFLNDDVYQPNGLATELSLFLTEEIKNYNYNENLEISGDTANNLKFFSSSYYPKVVINTDKPSKYSHSITINDEINSGLRLHSLNYKIPTNYSKKIHLKWWAKKGTANSHSVLVQEFNNDTFIQSFFYGVDSPTDWTEYYFKHIVTNSNCNNLLISLVPATKNGDVSLTGTTHIAGLVISKSPIGYNL